MRAIFASVSGRHDDLVTAAPRTVREAPDAAARSWHISTGSPTDILEGPPF
jgi:hypothetical protein